jgi:hypothetical protein
MNRKLLGILMLLQFVLIKASGQEFTERVYLKDSVTFYEGYVIEQSPAQYVKVFRIKQKDTLTVPMIQIWKLTKHFKIDTIAKAPDTTALPRKIKERYSKAIFFELLGNAGIYSINYDMRTAKNKRNGWGFRVGFETLGINGKTTDPISGVEVSERINITAVPFALNYLFGSRKDFLELGVGATYAFITNNGNTVFRSDQYNAIFFNEQITSMFGTFNVGYRRIPVNNGITYNVTFTPVFIDGTILPYGGVGVGYHF